MTDIGKHPLLREIHEASILVERLGASDKLTEVSAKLGEIMRHAERVIDGDVVIVNKVCGDGGG